jgi:hypothetical protein
MQEEDGRLEFGELKICITRVDIGNCDHRQKCGNC